MPALWDLNQSSFRSKLGKKRAVIRPCATTADSWPRVALSQLQYGVTVIGCREWRKVGEGFGLVPVSHGVKTVGAIVGMTMFDGVLEIFAKRYRIVRVPAVEAIASARLFGSADQVRAVVKIGKRYRGAEAAKIPGAAKIIFQASSVNAWPLVFVVVDEDHFVAFPHPAIALLQHSEGYPHEVSAATSFGENIILFAVKVQLLFAFAKFDGGVRRGLSILRVKV